MPKVSNRYESGLVSVLNVDPHNERDWLTRLGKRVVLIGDCWVVDGRVDVYPRCNIGGVTEDAHRAVYREMHPGVNIADLHVHHECQRPGCINPSHLMALTPREHNARHRQAS